MNPEIIKLFVPVLIIAAWLAFAFRVRTPLVAGAGLFFASYAAFSANFTFVYRELHQLIQISLICLFIVPAMRSGLIFKVNLFFLIMLSFVGLSLVYAPFDEDAKSQFINLLVAIGVVNYLLSALRTNEDIHCVLHFIALLSVLLACIGVLEFAFNQSGRVEATFSNPNYYGLFLGVGSCVVLATWGGLLRNMGFVLVLAAIIMSGSRSAIAFPLLQVLWTLYRAKNTRKYFPLVIGSLLFTVLFLNYGLTRFKDTSQTQTSDTERVIFARIALRMANSHPLTGVGWGRFINEFGSYSTLSERILTSSGVVDVSDQERRVTHNDYLRILAELGWIAFVFSIAASVYGMKLLINKNGFGLEYLLPVWLGMLFFSIGHNNMNSAFFWAFFLLPFFLNSRRALPVEC